MKLNVAVITAGTVIASACAAEAGISVKLTPISTPFPGAIGIDYHQPTDSVVMSVNYPSGSPNSFVRVKADGTQLPFSTVSGLTDEVKLATARSGSAFPTGTVFTGNGIDGQITKISPDGTSFISAWVDLPGVGNGLMRGSLHVDRTGVWGGDLLAVTTTGEAWRINSAGTPTKVADVPPHLEGLMSVPDNVAKYGPLAGKMIAGAEGSGLLYAFDTAGGVTTHSLGVAIEDIDMINANENFYGVNYGTGKLLGAPASYFTSAVGDILLTQEFGGTSGLFTLKWNGSTLVTEAVTLTGDSFDPGQWEHVTFAPAGIVEIPPVPEPSTYAVGLLLLAPLAASFIRRSKQPAAQ